MQDMVKGTLVYLALTLGLVFLAEAIDISYVVRVSFVFLFAMLSAFIAGMRVVYPLITIEILIWTFIIYILYSTSPDSDTTALISIIAVNKYYIASSIVILVLGVAIGGYIENKRNVAPR